VWQKKHLESWAISDDEKQRTWQMRIWDQARERRDAKRRRKWVPQLECCRYTHKRCIITGGCAPTALFYGHAEIKGRRARAAENEKTAVFVLESEKKKPTLFLLISLSQQRDISLFTRKLRRRGGRRRISVFVSL